jgi:hypothetical protein
MAVRIHIICSCGKIISSDDYTTEEEITIEIFPCEDCLSTAGGDSYLEGYKAGREDTL